MARELDDWLSGYITYTEATEPPLLYHTWVGISLIAGCLQRKVYLKWGLSSTVYPNHYIVLIGPSGQSRKGEAITIGLSLIDEMNIPVSSQRITPQALIKVLHDESEMLYKDESTGQFVTQHAIYCVSDELMVFLGIKNIDFLADLTDWYDCRRVWTYETKHGDQRQRIDGLCFNLLGATAPDWLSSILPHEAVGGGWTSRTIFVVEEYKAKSVADPRSMKINEDMREKLLNDLSEIKLLTGEIQFEEDALLTYIKWYEQTDKNIKNGKPPIADPKLSGYVSRRATHVRKLAMVMCVSRGDGMVITKRDFERALSILEMTERKMPKAFTGLGRARFADSTEDILAYIIRKGKVKRSEVLQRFYRDVDQFMLEQIEKVLENMKSIKITILVNEQDLLYEALESREET